MNNSIKLIGLTVISAMTVLSTTLEDEKEPELLNDRSTRTTLSGSLRLESSLEYQYAMEGEDDYQYVHLLIRTLGQEVEEREDRSDLNIALVMDRSGSMKGEKLDNAKIACESLINELGADDRISLVTYSDMAEVLKKSSTPTEVHQLKRKVWTMKAEGNTNLSEGLEQGVHQVRSTLDRNRVNRVLLFSDGLANRGITDEGRLSDIARRTFEQEGIAVSTFGVGADYNEDLMTEIAESGSGLYHYIASADDMAGILDSELKGMMEVVAQNSYLNVRFPSQYFSVDKVFGYHSNVAGNNLSIDFNDISSGMEKTVLIRFKRLRDISEEERFSVSLTYDDTTMDDQPTEYSQDLLLALTDDAKVFEKGINEEVKKQMAIFKSTERFEEASKMASDGELDKAREMIQQNISLMREDMDGYGSSVELERSMEMNNTYFNDLEESESMSPGEFKQLQKANKSANYRLKKKL